MKKSEKKKLHSLVREFVMLRDKRCLKCGKSDRLHASHIYPRGKYPKMQFNLENVKALCVGCHLYWWHKHPIEAREWAEKTLGKALLSRLKKRANTINKEPWNYKDIKHEIEQKIMEFEDS
jgi:5-methylcytosine-specific restriction endonuclease McrA|tara:strand:+ start:1036 stop:1398 length:363 start_codon:yes stop_codon:yes gene_type:complete